MAVSHDSAARPVPPDDGRIARWVRGCVILLFTAVIVFSRTIAVPALGAVLLSIALFPIVNWAARRGVPRGLASILVLMALIGISSGILYAVRHPLAQLASQGPQLVSAGHKLLARFEPAEQPARVARQDAVLQEVVAKQSEHEAVVDLIAPLAAGITASLVAIGTALILTHFMLTCGKGVGRATLAAARGRRDRRSWLRVCGSIRTQAAHYLQLVTAINLAFGLATGVMLALLGVRDAPAYGVIAGLMNFIPIIGALATTALLLADGLVQQGLTPDILLPAVMFLLLHLLESQFITPQLLGRRLLLNPLIVITGVLVGAAAWGVGGAFLAVPILTSVKLALDAHPHFRRWGQVLGRGALVDCQVDDARRARLRRRPRASSQDAAVIDRRV